jgi:hypothetical protein
MAQDAGHNVKTLGERIGHTDTSITMKIDTHRSQGADRPLAQAMGNLIARNKAKARTIWSGPSVVAGAGFEPATSGL